MSVTLQIKINGGAPQTGAVTAAVADSVQLTAASMATWGSPAALWVLYDYPTGFACPAGWTTDASGSYSYQGNSDPPAFSITSGHEGRYVTRLTAYDGGVVVTDSSTAIDVPFAGGFSNIGRGEGAVFGGARLRWAGPLKAALKYLRDRLGSFGAATAAATPSTIMARDGSGNTAVVGLTSTTVTSTGILNLVAAAGQYCSVKENATEVCRILDNGAQSTLTMVGTAGGRIESTAAQLLFVSGGSGVMVQHGSASVCSFDELSTVSRIIGQGAGGTRLSATTGALMLRSAAASPVTIQESTTDVLQCDDDAGVARLSGRGASGTRLEANASNLTLRCASGSVVAIQEGTTTVAELRDDAGVAELRLKGGSANRITADNAIIMQPASGYYTQLNDGTGGELMTLVSNYIRLPTNAPVGAIPGGYAALGFNGTDLILRVGSTNYTIQKV